MALKGHVAGQVGILVRALQVARVNTRRGKRHSAMQVGKLTVVSSVRGRRV